MSACRDMLGMKLLIDVCCWPHPACARRAEILCSIGIFLAKWHVPGRSSHRETDYSVVVLLAVARLAHLIRSTRIIDARACRRRARRRLAKSSGGNNCG